MFDKRSGLEHFANLQFWIVIVPPSWVPKIEIALFVNVELNETPSIITDFGIVFKPTSIALYPVWSIVDCVILT